MLRHALTATLVMIALYAGAASALDALPSVSPVLNGYREDSVTVRMAQAPLRAIEGLWELAGDGALLAVERGGRQTPETYVIAVVYSPDAAIRPGTVIGWLTPAAAAGAFNARLYTARTDDGTRLTRTGNFTARLSDDGDALIIKPYGRKFRINWWRLLLPYNFKGVVTPLENVKDNIDGFRRVYPSRKPRHPRYL